MQKLVIKEVLNMVNIKLGILILAIIGSAGIGYTIFNQLKSKPISIVTDSFTVNVRIPGSYKATTSADEATIEASYGEAIDISKEVEKVSESKLSENVIFRMGTTITKDVEDLISKQYKDTQVVSKETFKNGFGAVFADKDGRKFFRYIIKTGDMSISCQSRYLNMSNISTFIGICKSIN